MKFFKKILVFLLFSMSLFCVSCVNNSINQITLQRFQVIDLMAKQGNACIPSLRIRPYYDDEKIIGHILSGITGMTLFDLLGFENNDVLYRMESKF